MKTDAKTRVLELFYENIGMVNTNQTEFRRKVMQSLIVDCSTLEKRMTEAAAATHYNNAKKIAEKAGAVEGLGRCINASAGPDRKNNKDMPFDDSDCITVLEVIDNTVIRTESFINEELARTKLKQRLSAKFPTMWKLIKGLGPNVGDTYKLSDDEYEMA